MSQPTITEKPILFSGEMVRAILSGKKTQTRRVVTDSTSQGNFRASELLLTDDDPRFPFVDAGPSPVGNPGPYLHAHLDQAAIEARRGPEHYDPDVIERLYPRWFPGDRLWVRETAWYGPQSDRVEYDADFDELAVETARIHGAKKRPSIHMPKWACRLWLEVVSVRVERVQEITLDDCEAEGVQFPECARSVANFARLWDSINAKRGYSWESNPWVWVVEFKKEKPCSGQ